MNFPVLLFTAFMVSAATENLPANLVPKVFPNMSHGFIEDVEVTFTCEVADKSKFVYWSIRDRISKIETFYENELRRRTRKRVKNGLSQYRTIVRREFNEMEVVCRTGNNREGSFLLPKIKKTLPIKTVRFISKDLKRGQKLRLWCDVEASVNVVKKVKFRNIDAIMEAINSSSFGNGWTRYELATDFRVDMNNHNDLPIQCFASVNTESSAKGIVASKVIKLKVHYLQFLSGSSDAATATKGSLMNVTFLVEANPKPDAMRFKILQLPLKSNEFFKKRTSVTSQGSGKYAIKSQFRTEKATSYVLRYSTPVFGNDSKPLFINITYFELQETRKWKSREQKNGTPLRLHFWIFANPLPPSKEINFRLRLKTRSGFQHRDVKEVEDMQKVDCCTYFVVLIVTPTSSGSYQLIVSAKNMSHEGSTFQIDLSGYSAFDGQTMAIIFLVIILFIVFIIIFLARGGHRIFRMGMFKVTVASYVTKSDGEMQMQEFLVRADDLLETFMRQIDAKMNESLYFRSRLQLVVYGSDSQSVQRFDVRTSKEEGKKLKDLGICKNSRIILKSFDSVEIHIMESNLVNFKTETLELTGSTCDWREIKKVITEKLQLESIYFTYQRAYIYKRDGNLRYGIATEGNEEKDEEDAIPLKEKVKKLVVCLEDKSLLRFAPYRRPVIFIRPEATFYGIGDDGQLRTIEADSNPFKDRSFCGYIRGIRSDADDIEKMFFDSAEGSLFNYLQEEAFPNREMIVEDSENQWRLFYVFLKEEKTDMGRRIKLPTSDERMTASDGPMTPSDGPMGTSTQSAMLSPHKESVLYRDPYSIRIYRRNDCCFKVVNDKGVIIDREAPIDCDWYSPRFVGEAEVTFTRNFFHIKFFGN